MMTRWSIAAIFYALAVVFFINGLQEIFGYETDGLEVILNFGNGLLALFFALIFAAPEPDTYDRIKINGDPHAVRDRIKYREKNRHQGFRD